MFVNKIDSLHWIHSRLTGSHSHTHESIVCTPVTSNNIAISTASVYSADVHIIDDKWSISVTATSRHLEPGHLTCSQALCSTHGRTLQHTSHRQCSLNVTRQTDASEKHSHPHQTITPLIPFLGSCPIFPVLKSTSVAGSGPLTCS